MAAADSGDDEPPAPRSRYQNDDAVFSLAAARPQSTLLSRIAEHVNVKLVHRKLVTLARVLVTITFFEDALRMLTDYSVQVRTMHELVEHNTNFVPASLTQLMPALSAALQLGGVVAVVSNRRPITGCIVLLCWCALHPFVYGQQRNYMFMSETVTVMGGLLILMADFRQSSGAGGHLSSHPARRAALSRHGDDLITSYLELAGRTCVTCYFVYYAFHKLQAAFASPSLTIIDMHAGLLQGAMMVVLFYVSVLVIIGAKSRRIAIVLAAIMFGTNLYWHPFWMHWGYGMGKLSREHGHLSIDVDVNSANEAQLPTLDTQSKLLPIALQGLQRASSAKKKPRVLISVSDHERYFFCQRLSTVGALLLLAVHGPGRHSVDEPAGSLPLSTYMHAAKGSD